MKNKRVFGERDFREYFKKVLDRFEVKKEGVFLAAGDMFEDLLSEDELAVLRPHPWKSRDNPALAFPFSYSDAEKFASFYDLWGEVHMRRLCCASEEIMSLEHVAELLEIDLSGLWALMQPQNDSITNQLLPVLQPSVFFDRVYLHWRGESGEEVGGDLHGLFELFNSRGIRADSRGRVEVSFLEKEGVFYAIPSGREKPIVNVSRIYVTRGDLDNYLQAVGKALLGEEKWENELGSPSRKTKETAKPISPPLPHSTETGISEPNAKPDSSKDFHGVGLAGRRHNKRRPTRQSINEVVSEIKRLEREGKYWHQVGVVDWWLAGHPETQISRSLFIAEVKSSLPECTIPKVGRPKK